MKRGVHFLCCAAFGLSGLGVACSSDDDGGTGGARVDSAGAGGSSSGGSGNVMTGGAGTATSGGSAGRAGAGGSTGGAAGASGHAGVGTDAGTDAEADSGVPDATAPEASLPDAATDASLSDAMTIDGGDGHSATDAPFVPRTMRFQVKTNGFLLQDPGTHYYGTVSHVDPGIGAVCATTRCQVNGYNPDQACMNCYHLDALPTPTCILDTCTFVIPYANDGVTVSVQAPGMTYRIVDPTITIGQAPPQQDRNLCNFVDDPTLGPYVFCNFFAPADPTVLTLIFTQN